MKMNMKKIISWGMMLAATFTLTNCAKEIDAPVQEPESVGYPFEIIASTVDTKTVNDGMSTKWAAEDQINLFHAVCDSDDYKNNGVFEVKETESGNFKGELCEKLDPQEEYDWYAFYPYKSQIVSPKNEAGWAYIGNKNGITQEGGYGKTAHLASSNCPLYGVAKAVPAADMPSIEMHHLSSVVAINVTNMTDEPLTVTGATFTANEPIVGSFYIDFSDVPTYTASEEQYVSNAATVNVKGGTALGKGDSGVLYLVVKPFTAAKDSKLYLSVNGYEKELTMPQDVTFTAGKIKTLNFKYDKAPTPHVTWDLTKASYASASAEKVEWISEFVNLTLERGEGNEAANAYLGGDNAHTRVYQKHIMTFDPLGKYQIESVEFNVTESGYVEKLTNSTWTNGEVSNKGTIVTVIPTDGHKNVAVTIGAATRFTGITVYYSYDEDYVLPTVKSLTVSGQTLEFVQNTEFDFDGTVTATYTDDTTLDVTDKVTTSSPNMTTTGTKEVTVSYTEGGKTYTTSYEIEVIEASALSGWIETSFADLKGGDQVVIVGIKSSTHYAMSDDKGTSSGPLPVKVTTSGDKLSEEPAESIVWTVGVNGDNRIFYADATKKTWLYCTSTNNGVRVGTNTANAFAWDKNYLKHDGTGRYLGIYNTQDWRCYTSNTATNIVNQTFKFYVKVGGGDTTEPDPTPAPVELVMSDVICSDQTETSLTFTWDAVEGASSYQVYFDNVDKGTITATSYTASGLTAGTSHTIAVKAVGDGVNYNTSASAKTCTASTKTAQGEGEGTTVTLTIKATAGTKSSDGKSISWTQDGFTVTNTQANGSTAIRTSDSDHYRVYQGSLLNFTSSNKTFNKVVVTCTSSSYATVLQTSAKNAGLTASVSGSVVTISTSTPTSAMTAIEASAQTRINKVEVELN